MVSPRVLSCTNARSYIPLLPKAVSLSPFQKAVRLLPVLSSTGFRLQCASGFSGHVFSSLFVIFFPPDSFFPVRLVCSNSTPVILLRISPSFLRCSSIRSLISGAVGNIINIIIAPPLSHSHWSSPETLPAKPRSQFQYNMNCKGLIDAQPSGKCIFKYTRSFPPRYPSKVTATPWLYAGMR